MPVTPAHTIAVLPFVRSKKLCASALIAGSMAPDFEYFIRMNVNGIWGHDFPGIFLFDLPMTFAMVVAFHLAVKNRLIDNLPRFFQKRFAHLKALTLRRDIFERPVTFAICACVGALTHVVWDGFTHAEGFFVQELPGVYRDAYVPYGNVDYPLWYSLQYISTGVGMFILIVYLLLLKPTSSETNRPGIGYWFWLAVIAAVVVAVRFQFPRRPGEDMWYITAISGLCIGMILLGLLPARRQSQQVKAS